MSGKWLLIIMGGHHIKKKIGFGICQFFSVKTESCSSFVHWLVQTLSENIHSFAFKLHDRPLAGLEAEKHDLLHSPTHGLLLSSKKRVGRACFKPPPNIPPSPAPNPSSWPAGSPRQVTITSTIPFVSTCDTEAQKTELEKSDVS